MSAPRFTAAESWELDGYPEGLRYSERQLWDDCPEAREALERLVHARAARRRTFWVNVLASMPGTALTLAFGYGLGAGWFS